MLDDLHRHRRGLPATCTHTVQKAEKYGSLLRLLRSRTPELGTSCQQPSAPTCGHAGVVRGSEILLPALANTLSCCRPLPLDNVQGKGTDTGLCPGTLSGSQQAS